MRYSHQYAHDAHGCSFIRCDVAAIVGIRQMNVFKSRVRNTSSILNRRTLTDDGEHSPARRDNVFSHLGGSSMNNVRCRI